MHLNFMLIYLINAQTAQSQAVRPGLIHRYDNYHLQLFTNGASAF